MDSSIVPGAPDAGLTLVSHVEYKKLLELELGQVVSVTVTVPSRRPWVQRMYTEATVKQLAALLQRDGVLDPPFVLADESLGVNMFSDILPSCASNTCIRYLTHLNLRTMQLANPTLRLGDFMTENGDGLRFHASSYLARMVKFVVRGARNVALKGHPKCWHLRQWRRSCHLAHSASPSEILGIPPVSMKHRHKVVAVCHGDSSARPYCAEDCAGRFAP